jgi:hypothetical protein
MEMDESAEFSLGDTAEKMLKRFDIFAMLSYEKRRVWGLYAYREII